MNRFVATIYFNTTDKQPEPCERLIANIVEGHGLEIIDVHVEPVEEPTPCLNKQQ